MEPRIQYATTSDRVSIALWAMGEGMPFVHMPSPPSTVSQAIWHAARMRDAFERLGRKRLLVRYDSRGFGHSERDIRSFTLEAWLADLEAVADHLGLRSFALFAMSQSAPIAIAYAAAHPERVTHLVFWNGSARGRDLVNLERQRALLALADVDWEFYTEAVTQSQFGWSGSEEARRAAAANREGQTPAALRIVLEAVLEIDVSHLLPKIECPTLVMHGRAMPLPDINVSRRLVTQIPHAQLAVLDAVHPYRPEAIEPFFHALDDFLGEGPAAPEAAHPPGMTAILFLDIAGSTELTTKLGDAAYREKERQLDGSQRRAIREAGGSPVEGKVLGDGVMATFASAKDAIDAALRCQALGEGAGLPLHAGIHAGDVTREGNNVHGGAVQVAARIADASTPGDVLVSDIVRGLARTSAGVSFDDRGEHDLKCVSEPVRVFAVRSE